MSLINQMLRDLDERREQKSAQIHEINLPQPPERQFPWFPVLAAAVICLVIAAGLIGYLAGNQNQPVPIKEQNATVASGPEKEPVRRAAVVPLKPAGTDSPNRENPAIDLPRITEGKDESDAHVPQTGVSTAAPAPEKIESTKGEGVSQVQTSEQGQTLEVPVEEPGQTAPEGGVSEDTEELGYLPLIVADELARTESEPAQTNTLSATLKRESRKTQKTEVSVLENVRKFVSEGRLAEAEAVLWHELKQHPDTAEVRESLATLLIRGKRYVEATALVQQGRELTPDYPPFVGLQARILLEQGDTESARILLEGHLHGRGGDQALLSMLGVVYQQEGAFVKAQAIYARLLELDRTSAGYWAGLAIALDGSNDEVRSLEAFRRALALGGLPVAVYDYARQRVIALSGK